MTSFKDKYTDDKAKEPSKIEITKEAYAIGELLQEILGEFRRNRK